MYLLENETGQKTRFSVYGNPVDSEWFYLCWSLCEPFQKYFSVPIRYDRIQMDGGRPKPLTDRLLCSSDQLLVSEKMYELLKPYSSCMKAYPSVIYYKNEVIGDNYYTLKFDKDFSALNWKLSEYALLTSDDYTSLCEYAPSNPTEAINLFKTGIASKKYVGDIRRLVLDRTRLPTREQIFRLAEENGTLIVTEQLKKLLEDSNITGIAFTPIEVTDDNNLPFVHE